MTGRRMLERDRPPSYYSLQAMVVASIAETVAPPERLTVSEAAVKYVEIKEKNYSGNWSADKTPYVVEPQNILTSLDHTGMVFVGPARTGKALALDTPLATPTGWTTMGEVQIGDRLFGSDGAICRVVALTPVMIDHDCFRISFDDGSHIVADAGHKWACYENDTRTLTHRVLTTAEMVAAGVMAERAGVKPRYRFLVPNAAPIQCPHVDLPIDPYVLGVWLGDGTSAGISITAHRADVPHYVRRIKDAGYTVFARMVGSSRTVAKISVDSTASPTLRHYCPRGHDKRQFGTDGNNRCRECSREDWRSTPTTPKIAKLRQKLVSAGLLNNKHIPAEYLRASVEQRLALLHGLIDTDGCIAKDGHASFCNTSDAIADGFAELLSGLGVKFRRAVMKTHAKPAHVFNFTMYRGFPPASLPRKLERVPSATRLGTSKIAYRRIVAIEHVPSVPVRCIQVDAPDSLFLAGRQMVPTHNSQMFLNWMAHTAKCDPADMMLLQMSQARGREFSLSDLAKLFRNSPEIRKLLVPGRQNDNVFDKSFLSGMRVTITHPSINELSGKTSGRNWSMDFDRLPTNIDGEGDPWSLLKKRATTLGRYGMTVAESSPGFPVTDAKWIPQSPHEAPPAEGILSLYNMGDRRRWYWRCPQCHGSFEPDFKLLQYPKSADPMESAEQVVMVCPHDGYPMSPNMQFDLNLGGRWLREGLTWNADGSVTGTPRRSDIASFWMKGPAAAFTTWSELVLKYLNAEDDYERTGSEEKLKTVTNTDLGLPYIDKSLEGGKLPEELKARAQPYNVRGEVPDGVVFLLTTVDVQKRSFVCHTFGFAPVQMAEGGWSFDIYHVDMWKISRAKRVNDRGEREILDPASFKEDWHVLIEETIERTYPLADGSGRRMQVRLVACDSGGAASAAAVRLNKALDGPVLSVTSNAYDFWRFLRDDPQGRRYHEKFHLLKGEPSRTNPPLMKTLPDSQQKDKFAIARGDVPVWAVNSNVAKDQADTLLRRAVATEEIGGRVHFPKWFDDDGREENIDWLYTQLTAENRIAAGWVNSSRKRNEAFDLLAYALAFTRHPMVRCDSTNTFFANPPAWARDWDRNDLVFSPTKEGGIPVAEVSERPGLANLGDMLL